MSFFTMTTAAEPTDEAVRTTLDPKRSDPVAQNPEPPNWNEALTDQSPALTGLSPRQVAPNYTPSTQFTPGWLNEVSGVNRNAIIDNQVSSSGTAAQREALGQFGHGSMAFADSLDPVIREEGVLGQVYFQREGRDAQLTAQSYMSSVPEPGWGAVAQSHAVQHAKDAWLSSIDKGWGAP